MESWSLHHLTQQAEKTLDPKSAADLRRYAQNLIQRKLPVIFTLGHLAQIVGVEYTFLRETVNRKREAANYRFFIIKKRSNGYRLIHTLCNDLLATQKFLNTELLQKVPVHPNCYAFHAAGGIRACASVHCGSKWLFQFDLDNFFHRITEIDVYSVFHNLGYQPLLASELAKICTTTRLPQSHSHLHKFAPSQDSIYQIYDAYCRPLGILPQGAPASPMLSNLVAYKLDEELAAFALQYGFSMTRYADDLTLSLSGNLPDGVSIPKILRSVVRIIRQCGFQENPKKIRVAGPGSKKLVLGLLVDGDVPRISKEMYNRVDRHLHASLKYGLVDVAEHEKFDSAIGFYNHLHGLVNFVQDVDKRRGEEFKRRFSEIPNPWNSLYNS